MQDKSKYKVSFTSPSKGPHGWKQSGLQEWHVCCGHLQWLRTFERIGYPLWLPVLIRGLHVATSTRNTSVRIFGTNQGTYDLLIAWMANLLPMCVQFIYHVDFWAWNFPPPYCSERKEDSVTMQLAKWPSNFESKSSASWNWLVIYMSLARFWRAQDATQPCEYRWILLNSKKQNWRKFLWLKQILNKACRLALLR